MRRRVLALLVLALMLVAMLAFAGLAFAQSEEPPAGRGCNGIDTARKHGATERKQGPDPTKANPKAHPAPGLGGC
jgi:hypothetical protein